MTKKPLPLVAVLALLAACNNKTDEPVAARDTVKQYSAEQLYNNKSINGVAFNAGETSILAGANITGILSSTVGSEAWNSRDLKSRPH